MKLTQALRIGDGEIVAFVGGGGKSTAMFRLAQEMVEAGGKVITTTTTRIFAAQIELAPVPFSTFEVNRAELEAALEQRRHVLVTAPVNREQGKASGVSLDLVRSLCAVPDVSAILIEADGSRMRPFKAPAAHEPVIPPETTLVVPVVGADVFGEPLTDVRVHRPELVRALTGAREGEPVTPELVARVLAHPQGGLKNIPPRARVLGLVNKVESDSQLAAARETARLLLREPRLAAVALGAAKQGAPVREVHGRVGAVVLAAGRSTRMGRPKQTLPWGETTIIGRVVSQLRAGGVDEIVVVTGDARAEVESALLGSGARLAFNPDFASGDMARSLQAGLRALPENCSAALVVLGDQPQIQTEVVQAVVQRWRETLAPIVAPSLQMRRGHPMLFDRRAWPGLLALPAGATPREYLRDAAIEYVEVQTDSILRDVDTPEDYERELEK